MNTTLFPLPGLKRIKYFCISVKNLRLTIPAKIPRGRVLPYMDYKGMCRFQAVYPEIGSDWIYKMREFGSKIGYHFPGN